MDRTFVNSPCVPDDEVNWMRDMYEEYYGVGYSTTVSYEKFFGV